MSTGKNIGGKQKDPIWGHFQEVTEIDSNGSSKVMQKCQTCNVLVSPRADRMKAHFLKGCANKDDSVKLATAITSENMKKVDFSKPKLSQVQPKMDRFVNKTITTVAEKLKLDILAAKFWFSANLPFSTANLATWKEFCEQLRPGYSPPSEYQIQGPLLETVYNDLRKDMQSELQGKCGTLVQDGWSDIHNFPIISHSVVTPSGQSYLIDSTETKDATKTAEYCANKFLETVEDLKAMGFTTVAGSTDNCNVMLKMRQILLEKNPILLLYGCSPHMLNLLCEDISPKQIVSKINEVSKFFRDHHKPASLLKEKKGLKPQLPASTRWISHLECVRIFLKNRTKYIEISQIPDVCSKTVSEITNCLPIFRAATELLIKMELISAELLKLQSDTANIADACSSWLKLYNHKCFVQYKKQIQARMDKCMADFFYVAYLLHPKYSGKLLSSKQQEIAFEYLLKKSPSFVITAQAFLARDITFFPKFSLNSDVMNETHPANWWLSVKGFEKIPNEFVDMMVTMYHCPCSTSSIERIFSTYGYIQTDTRNRLLQDKVMKLSFCFRALRRSDLKQGVKRKMLSDDSNSIDEVENLE